MVAIASSGVAGDKTRNVVVVVGGDVLSVVCLDVIVTLAFSCNLPKLLRNLYLGSDNFSKKICTRQLTGAELLLPMCP